MLTWQNAWVAGAGGVYASVDGVEWERVGASDPKVNAIGRQDDCLVAGCEWGLWQVGADGGWVQLHDETLTEVQDVVIVGGDLGAVAASAYGVAVGARDECGFMRWTSLSETLTVDRRFSNAIVVDPDTAGRWLVGTEAGVLVAQEHGASWEVADLAGCPVRALLYALGAFWAGTDARGVWRSQDGLQWQQAGTGAQEATVFALAASGERLLAGSLEGILVGDGQGAWQRSGPGMLTSALAVDPQGQDVWLAGASPGGLWRTEDAGQRWAQVGSFSGVGALIAPQGD